MNNALRICQQRYDNAEPRTPWIDTPEGLDYLKSGVRTLLLGFDTSTVKVADFIAEFSIARNEADQADNSFALDWALARGGMTTFSYHELAKEVAERMLYDKRDEAEGQLLWLTQ